MRHAGGTASPLFSRPERVGFNFVKAFSQGADPAYAAMSTAAKAAVAFANALGDRHAVIYVPVIVVDGPLFEYFLRETDVELRPISQGVVLWRESPRGVLIHVVSEQQLPSFVGECRHTAIALDDILRGIPDREA